MQKMCAGVFEIEQPMTACRCVQPLKLWFPSVFKLVPPVSVSGFGAGDSLFIIISCDNIAFLKCGSSKTKCCYLQAELPSFISPKVKYQDFFPMQKRDSMGIGKEEMCWQ